MKKITVVLAILSVSVAVAVAGIPEICFGIQKAIINKRGEVIKIVEISKEEIAATMPANEKKYSSLLARVCREEGAGGVRYFSLMKAMTRGESSFHPHLVSEVGAQGILQVIPSTAKFMGVRGSLFLPENCFRAGVRYVKYLRRKWPNDKWEVTLARYNAGPTKISRYGGKVPPFPGIAAYIQSIKTWWREYYDQEVKEGLLASLKKEKLLAKGDRLYSKSRSAEEQQLTSKQKRGGSQKRILATSREGVVISRSFPENSYQREKQEKRIPNGKGNVVAEMINSLFNAIFLGRG